MAKFAKLFDAATGSSKLVKNALIVPTDGATIADTTSTQTFTNKTLTSPTITNAVLTATNATLTTPTIETGAIANSVLSGTATGTYTLAGTPTISSPIVTNATVTLKTSTRAGTGTTIADANTITETSGTLILMTGGNNSVGIKLPVAVAGSTYWLKNDQAANGIMKLYPQVNSTINGLSANTNIELAANTACQIIAYNTTNWMTFSLLPS